MADSANGDGEDDCGTEAEVIAEMYLKEPGVSRSEHIHPSIKEGRLALLSSSSLQVLVYTSIICCFRAIV